MTKRVHSMFTSPCLPQPVYKQNPLRCPNLHTIRRATRPRTSLPRINVPVDILADHKIMIGPRWLDKLNNV